MQGQRGSQGDAWKDYKSGAWKTEWKEPYDKKHGGTTTTKKVSSMQQRMHCKWRLHHQHARCLQVWGKRGSLQVCLHPPSRAKGCGSTNEI
eukprot:11623621-Prorocentrum_lima.AAC.1